MKAYWLNSMGIHLYAGSDLFAKRSKLPIELLCLSCHLQQEMNSKDQLFFFPRNSCLHVGIWGKPIPALLTTAPAPAPYPTHHITGLGYVIQTHPVMVQVRSDLL